MPHVVLHPPNSARPQAVMHCNIVTLIFQVRGNGEQAEGGHAVGHGGDISLAGQPVGAGRVDQNDFQENTLYRSKQFDSLSILS